MKKLILYFLIFLSNFAFSQVDKSPKLIRTDHSGKDWFLEIQSKKPNFKHAKELYDLYFKAHPFEKSTQRNIAIRWFMINADNQNAKGEVETILPSSTESKRLFDLNNPKKNKYAKTSATLSPYPAWNDQTGSWRMIGPYHNKVKNCGDGYAMSGGFLDRVYINPQNTQNLFVGQSFGGLWVSKNQGATWKLTDAEFPNGKNEYANRDVYYGDIKVSKTNSNLVFAATEAGVLKSINGGDNWTLVNDLNYISKSTERAYFLAPSNHDANLLLASYGKKIYRSTNGGSTWNVVFDNSGGGDNYNQYQHVTNGVYERKYNFAGISFHPTKNNIAYLAVRNAANQLEIHHSRNFGQTWALMVNTTRTEPFKMQVISVAPNKIYLFELFPDLSTTQTRTGIIKYDTTGLKVHDLKYPETGHLQDDCTVSETDSSIIYLGGYASGEVHKSTNGGLTFNTNNPGYVSCPNYIHPDIRGIHAVGDVVLIGSDGGASISTDAMTTVENTGQWISGIDLWGFSSAFKGDKVGAGDDHGPTEMRWFDGESGWEHIGGADSKDITINPAQSNWIYAADVYRKFKMTTNDSSYNTPETVVDANLKYLAFHPNKYGVAYPYLDSTLFVSADNMRTITDTLFTFPENISKVKIALKNPSIFYVLVDKKYIYKSTNGGLNFNPITPNSLVTNGRTNISDIEVSNDGQTIWLSYGEVQTDCKVVKSTNGGSTWLNYSTGLPSAIISQITAQRGTNAAAYASTNGGGIWYRDNAMSSWSLLGTGLPMMGYVTSSYVVPDKKAFRMGTSRGAFEHELAFNTSADALISVDNSNKFTCSKDTAFFRDLSAYQGTTNTQFNWTFEGGIPATSTAMNPKVLYPNAGIFDVSLSITDTNGMVSTHQLPDFMNISIYNCGIDTLRGKALVSTDQYQYVKAKWPIATPSNNFTVMAWIKLGETSPNTTGILSLKNASTRYDLNTHDFVGDSTELRYHPTWWWGSGLFIKKNQWHHVAMVVQPDSITLYRDGIKAKNNQTTAPILFENLAIGTMIDAEWYRTLVGEIDEVAVYKRALNPNDIRKMMHLTKNNPKYPAQFDADLVAYYQFNERDLNLGILDRVGNKDALPNSTVGLTTSSAPIGSGVSELVSSITRGKNDFNSVGITFHTPAVGILPKTPLTIYRLDEKPFPAVDSLYKKYWIWRNWTAGNNFAPLDSVKFHAISFNQSDLDNPANFSMQYRTANGYLNNWILSNKKPSDLSSTGFLKFGNSQINTFGQLILSRKPNPCNSNLIISSGPSNKKQKYQTTTSIITQGLVLINVDNKIKYSSNGSILLKPGFEAKKGSFFSSTIGGGCDNN
jgi:Concanavalin A-like lectin/glucanases superfamily